MQCLSTIHVRVYMAKNNINFIIKKMKNLKKLTRSNLKNVFGGNPYEEMADDAGDNLWRCCNAAGQCSGCAGYGSCGSNKLVKCTGGA